MPSRILFLIAVFAVTAFVADTCGAETPKYRTDQGDDKTLLWFQLKAGEFPPPDSAHTISGELIQVDHLERRFRIRVDRNDSQQAGYLDLPLNGVMLPYGSIYFHGAPAALQDVPLGTHLHGQFYLKDPNNKSPPPPGPYKRVTSEAAFSQCFMLEDDFSHYTRLKQIWKIEEVSLAEKRLTATLQREGKPTGTPQQFDLLSRTLVYRERGFGDLDALQAGQLVQINLDWVTLYGPGRITAVWIDDEARTLATSQQLKRHRDHIRERGLPGWIEAVDDEKQIVTITFFDGVDPKLFEELTGINEEPHGWPFSGREDNPKAPKGGICVARDCLMTYDPVNDRKGGNILHIGKVPLEPGSSGVQIQVKCCLLLEGFRPGGIIRFYPATWKVQALPQEEQFHGRE